MIGRILRRILIPLIGAALLFGGTAILSHLEPYHG